MANQRVDGDRSAPIGRQDHQHVRAGLASLAREGALDRRGPVPVGGDDHRPTGGGADDQPQQVADLAVGQDRVQAVAVRQEHRPAAGRDGMVDAIAATPSGSSAPSRVNTGWTLVIGPLSACAHPRSIQAALGRRHGAAQNVGGLMMIRISASASERFMNRCSSSRWILMLSPALEARTPVRPPRR